MCKIVQNSTNGKKANVDELVLICRGTCDYFDYHDCVVLPQQGAGEVKEKTVF